MTRKDITVNKPSRPKTAYNIFFQTVQKDVQLVIQKNTGKKGTYTQRSMMIGQRWRNTSEREKIHYQSLAAKDKQRYGIELVRWHELKRGESLFDPNISDLNSRKPKNVQDLQLNIRLSAKNESVQMSSEIGRAHV